MLRSTSSSQADRSNDFLYEHWNDISGRARASLGQVPVIRPPADDLMPDDCDRDRLSFLDLPLPRRFERQVITLAPGGRRRYDKAEWRDAIVLIERGEIELEGVSGRCCRFGPGDILWLVGVPLRALHNVGSEPVVLVAVSRRP